MAARAALTRLAPARNLTTAARSPLALATARAALQTTPIARSPRAPSVLIPRRDASTDEGAQTMVRCKQPLAQCNLGVTYRTRPNRPRASAAGNGTLTPDGP